MIRSDWDAWVDRAANASRNAMRAVLLDGADPFKIGLDLRQNAFEAQHVRKQRRALMEPDEILSLGADKSLVLAGGYHLMPFLSEKVPYYLRRSLAGAGRAFPNPYVDRDLTTISIPTRFGMRRRRIIEEAAPPSWLAHLPQYARGRPFRYVEGFKPSRP